MCAVRVPVELASVKGHDFYSIGQSAEMTGVSAKMIRHYESLGLIPKARRTSADYRVYSMADLHALRFVRRARDLGFSIKEIQQLLGLWSNKRRASAEVKRLVQHHIAALERKLAELEAMRATLADLAKHCHGDARPECPILEELGKKTIGSKDNG